MTKDDKNSDLSARQIKALPVFASTSNYDEACKQVGISRNCFYEWLKQPAFKAELNRMRDEMVSDAVAQLKMNSTKAAMTLSDLMDRTESPAVQRAAANDVLNHVMKFKEILEIETRLAALEQQIKDKQ